MANKTITDYTAAVTIDGSADYFLLEQGGTYVKINRNTIMSVTGTPADISSSQSISNKTMANSNSYTIKDGSLTLQNTSDTTKKAVFSLSGITTGTTRTYTLPNATDTLAGIAATQTFTNKTLTSPTITGGSIDNSTITVDSISGHTSGTIVTVANLQISNGVLNTNNSVVTANITDGAVTPSKLVSGTGSGWAWSSWSPSYTNLTVGNGTVVARYIQIGKTVHAEWHFNLGSTSSISGLIAVSLPVTASSSFVYSFSAPIGTLIVEGFGTSAYPGVPIMATSTTVNLYVFNASGTYDVIAGTSATVPKTFAANDNIGMMLTYEAA